MKKKFENNDSTSKELSAQELQIKKELNQRVLRLKKVAEAYIPQNAELEELVESIKELLADGEFEKADTALDQAEKRAKEIQDEKIRHPYESARQTFFHQAGYEIARIRERKTININDLAQESGIETFRIKAIERGEANDVTLDELYKLAKAMNYYPKFELEEHHEPIQ